MRACAGGLLSLSFIFGLSILPARARPVVAQTPDLSDTTGPMLVALLVDTSDGVGSAMTQIRAAVAAFADALPLGHELMLVTTGRHTQVRVPPTSSYQKVKNSASGLTADHGPTPLADALIEIDDRFLRGARDRWGAMVVITGDGSESSIRTDDAGFNEWLASVSRRRMSIDAVVLQFQPNGMPEVIARAATRATGGRLENTTLVNALAGQLKAIAERLGADHPTHR